jgi:glucosamine kinase
MLLAVDAGGTSTRAVALDTAGAASGYGRGSGGNPTSAGVERAVSAIGGAISAALGSATAGSADPPGHVALIAMAGVRSAEFRELLTSTLAGLGVQRVVLSSDLLGIFGSGTYRPDGYVLVAGTGSIAARIAGDRVERIVGGNGWLLGDDGSGFWVGQRVARAVVAALDDAGPVTALTELVLAAVGLPLTPGSAGGRARALSGLVARLYAQRPVQLAELAPLAFAVPDDPVARDILEQAADALAALLAAARVPEVGGPVVAGGSVLVHGLLAGPVEVRERLGLPAGTEVVPVADGVVGAAVLALREAGVTVGAELFERVQQEVARVRLSR